MIEEKKVYLSGPITGRREKDMMKHFRRVEWILKLEAEKLHKRIRVISPAALNPMGLSWDSYMKIAEAIILDPSVDAICLMKGWEQSEGCQREVMLAKAAGLAFIYEPGAEKAQPNNAEKGA